jgi:hypothetical protein
MTPDPEDASSPSSPPRSDASVLHKLVEEYGGRRGGDLPWEAGDSYLLGQLGRTAIILLLFVALDYLLSPVSFVGVTSLEALTLDLAIVFLFPVVLVLTAVVLILSALTVYRSQMWLRRTMILATDVPWLELAALVRARLQLLGVAKDTTYLTGWGILRGLSFSIRGDYAPVKVVGSTLGPVTWGGARSLFVVPLSVFRHPRLGQDLDHLMREVLGWEKPERVVTPSTAHADLPSE